MTPYYEHAGITLYHGDCTSLINSGEVKVAAQVMIADPPYGETSLIWDTWRRGWLDLVDAGLEQPCSAWVFGSFRSFLENAADFSTWTFAQEIIWEKQNGSSFHADRFRRIHETVAHFYRGKWADVYKSPVKTNDATARVTRRKQRPPHMGQIEGQIHVSVDGGPRLARSIQRFDNCHGYAEHPTQKPLGLVNMLLAYSAAPDSTVLDPFSGAGTVLVAAKARGLKAVGFEIEERSCEIAAKRLSQEVFSFEATA